MVVTSADVVRKVGVALGVDEPRARESLSVLSRNVHAVARRRGSVEWPGIGVLEFAGGASAGERARDAVPSLDGESDSAGSVLRCVSGVLRAELLQCRAIPIDAVGTFAVQRTAPRLENRDARQRLVSPPSVSFSFTPAAALADAAAGAKPSVRLLPDFEQALKALASTTVLIAVPTPDFFSDTVAYYFGKNGWATKVVCGVADAMQHLHAAGACAVVLDSSLQEAHKLCQALKGRKEMSGIPLVLLFPQDFQSDSPPSFLVVGDAQLTQPFEVRRLITVVESELLRVAEAGAIFQHQVTFVFPTDDGEIDTAYDFAHKLFEQSGLPEEGQVALAAAFREAVGNAAQHGNKYRKSKRIEVLYLLDREKITIVVKDAGEGFDHRRYVRFGRAGDALTAARERGREGKMGGLGIMLMLKCCDKVEYNQVGNAITLAKSLHAKPASAAVPAVAAPR